MQIAWLFCLKPRMSRISDVFDQAAQQARMTFMPFVTAGDPSLQSTSAVLKGLRDADVDLIELGFPYSDPIADGPVIQASYTRALDNDVTVHGILGMMDGRHAIFPILAKTPTTSLHQTNRQFHKQVHHQVHQTDVT